VGTDHDNDRKSGRKLSISLLAWYEMTGQPVDTMWFLTLHRDISPLCYHSHAKTPAALCLETPQCLCVREVAYLEQVRGRGKGTRNDFYVCPITSLCNGNLGDVETEGKYENKRAINEI
jgi:hypothetical protein